MKRLCGILVGLCLALPALGDVVHLKNGGTLEGQVVQTDAGVVIKLPVGEVLISKDAVAKIEKKETPFEEYQRRAAATKEDDPEAHYKLGLWAQSVGLKGQARDELGKTLALKPDHEGAHQALGHRKVEGVWMTREQEMQAKGLVQRGGDWMTPEAAAKLDQLQAELALAKEKRVAAETALRQAQDQAASVNPYAAYYAAQPSTAVYSYRYGYPYTSYYYSTAEGYAAPYYVTPYYWVRPYSVLPYVGTYLYGYYGSGGYSGHHWRPGGHGGFPGGPPGGPHGGPPGGPPGGGHPGHPGGPPHH